MEEFKASVFRKVTLRLIPFLVLAYLLNYVDRVNLGFAALEMNRDLGLTATTFGYGAGILFIGYFLFGVPSNMGLQKYGARIWLGLLLSVWGCIVVGMAFITNLTEFLVVRLLLGAVEAGFFPGVLFYLTNWFPAAYIASITLRFLIAQSFALTLRLPVSGCFFSFDVMLSIAGLPWWIIL